MADDSFIGRAFCPEFAPARLRRADGEAYAVAVVDKLLELAVRAGASDLHLEPQRRGLLARLRVDGVLRTLHEFPVVEQPALCSRLKVMAGMDIAERRRPQDGQASLRLEGRLLDLRVSTMPGRNGEKVVVRLLDKSGLARDLGSLGLEPGEQARFEELIGRPHGLVLVTGPTGSGKSTTLYAALERLRSPLKNVVTLEDPVEYELAGDEVAGVTQVQVHPKIGLTFAAGLRAALRQDPDVIMVGEIRDKETAVTAMQAAMTGHLVLSTLHTNDAPDSLGRLADMGVERYLIASTVLAVLAQRLVRLLCPRCKEEYRPSARALEALGARRGETEPARLFRSQGCADCQNGYRGRRGVFELLSMDDGLKGRVLAGDSAQALREHLAASGALSLRQSGLALVHQGLTTVEEILRVSAA